MFKKFCFLRKITILLLTLLQEYVIINKQPSGTIFIADSGYEFSDSNAGFCAKAFKHKEEGGYKRGVMLRHSGKANVLLGDWHAESLNEGELRNSLNRITYVLDMNGVVQR